MLKKLNMFIFLLLQFFLAAGSSSGVSAATPWGPMNEIEAAARKEAKLVIYAASGHTNPEVERAISELFKARYGISIDWTVGDSRDNVQRVLAEQRNKQYVVDVEMNGFGGGTTTELKPRGYLAPILTPSTLERNVWLLDPAAVEPKDRDWLFINMPLHSGLFINTNLVQPGEEPRSYLDLVEPRWKGKIVVQNPAIPGSGTGWFRATYRKLGLDYMRVMAKQLVLTTNGNDVPNFVARGQYSIGIAASPARARQLIAEGAPVRFVQPKEGRYLSYQGLSFIANAPHPNSAKLFLHWFYTQEGQTIYARNQRAVPLRKDVLQDYLRPDERYHEGAPFIMSDPEDVTGEGNLRVFKIAKEIFGAGK